MCHANADLENAGVLQHLQHPGAEPQPVQRQQQAHRLRAACCMVAQLQQRGRRVALLLTPRDCGLCVYAYHQGATAAAAAAGVCQLQQLVQPSIGFPVGGCKPQLASECEVTPGALKGGRHMLVIVITNHQQLLLLPPLLLLGCC